MSTYIIADIHLSIDTEILMNKFENFYSNLNSNDSVYIIGDLFNYYVGIEETNSAHIKLKNIFSNALKRNIQTFFQHGNRDFLLSKKDARYFNFNLIKDTEILEIDNNRIILVHGDELCNEKLS
jgi:UDP-2,3-diacylglucosamine hydrolase